MMMLNIYVEHFVHEYNQMRFIAARGTLQTANAVYNYFRSIATKDQTAIPGQYV